jgi:hypothetical protein
MPATTPPFLVNATGRPTWVLSGGKPVRLPEVNPPVVLSAGREDADARKTVQFAVTVAEGEGVADLTEQDESVASVILGDLPRNEHIIYLVKPLIKTQFPHRDDFVVPASYTMYTPRKLAKAMDSKNPKKRVKALKRYSKSIGHAKRFPLIAVSRLPLPVASPDTPALSLDD